MLFRIVRLRRRLSYHPEVEDSTYYSLNVYAGEMEATFIPGPEEGKMPVGVIEADLIAEQKSLRRFFEEREDETEPESEGAFHLMVSFFFKFIMNSDDGFFSYATSCRNA